MRSTFYISIQHLEWADRFAERYLNRLEGIDFDTAETGRPILPGYLSWVDCEVRHAYDGGDHTIFVGEVSAGGVARSGTALFYNNTRWRQLAEECPKARSR